MKLLIINGPSLNLVGTREPEIYGRVSMDDFIQYLRQVFPDHEIGYFQSNCEGTIIDALQTAGYSEQKADGIVLNPGAYAHYSYAIADAIASIPVPVVEVHISNIASREEFRHRSVTAAACKASIAGMGLQGYQYALDYLVNM